MTTWQKIKFWTKATIIFLFVVYVLFLLFWNGEQVKVWYFPWQPIITAPVWVLLLASFLVGSLVTIITGWMISGYFAYKRKQQAKTTKHLADEIAEMKRKAEMLQTKESAPSTTATTTSDAVPGA